VRNHQNIFFLEKFELLWIHYCDYTRFDSLLSRLQGACQGFAKTGRVVEEQREASLLLGLSEEQQGGLLLPGLAPGRIYSVCNVGLGLSEEQQGGLLLPGLAPGRIYSVCNVGCWRTIRSEAFDEFGTTLQSLTNKECSVATGPGGDAT